MTSRPQSSSEADTSQTISSYDQDASRLFDNESLRLELRQAVIFFQRHFLWILAWAVGAALLTTAFFFFFLKPLYRAVAKLQISTPTLTSELTPEVYSIYTYKNLLESDSVVQLARSHLVEEGVIPESFDLNVDQNLRAQLFMGARGQQPSTPLLLVAGRHRSAETAAKMANEWVKALIERSEALREQTTQAVISVSDGQYVMTETALQGLEDQSKALHDKHDRERQELILGHEQDLAKVERQTRTALYEYGQVTRAEMKKLAEADGLAPVEGSPSPEISQARKKLLQLLSLWQQLVETLPYQSLERTISNESLWDLSVEGGKDDLEAASQLRLLDHEPNPVYYELQSRLIDLEISLRDLGADTWQEIGPFVESLGQIGRARQKGYLDILEEKRTERAQLAVEHRVALQALDRAYKLKLDQLNRLITQKRQQLEFFSKNFEQIALAKAELEFLDPLQVVEPAIAPKDVEENGWALRAFLAFLAGGLVGFMTAMIRHLLHGSEAS